MIINSYKKKNNGQYEVILDNKSFLLHEDLILKYSLLIKKEIDEDELKKLENENKKYLVYDEALKYLKTKMRSINEMRLYLLKKEYKKELVEEVITMLIKQKYLDDDTYTKAFIHDKIVLSNDGVNKIRMQLKKNGVESDIIENNLPIFTKEIQSEKIEKLINKQIKTNHNKSKRVLSLKIKNDLVQLGYDSRLIDEKLYLLDEVDDSIIKEKEYQKIYDKLSKKYSGYELECKVKAKMIQKGFY